MPHGGAAGRVKDERKATQLMKKGQGVWIALFSCLFSACVTMGRRITFSGDVRVKNTENYIDSMTAADALLFFALAAIMGGALWLLIRFFGAVTRKGTSDEERKHPWRFAGVCSLVLLLVWAPYILSVAPGNIYMDSLESVSQMLEHGHPVSNHHPMFYTLMIGVFLKIGTVLFGSVNIGVLLYSLFQTGALILTIVCLLTLMYREGISRWLIGAALAYYLFVPFFPNYGMSMWKDVLFSCMLLLLSLLLYLIMLQDRPHGLWFAAYGAVGIGAMMMRNNGLYIFAAMTVLLVFLMRKHVKRLLAASAAALAIFVSASQLATAVWNIHGDFVENLGIPLLQLGYTINHEGNFSEEEKDYLFELVPRDVWGYAYRPCLVDPLKWNPQFDVNFLTETKAEFFRVWLSGLMKNPGKYIDAYLLATHGFWQPGVQNWYGYMDIQMNENPYGIGWMNLFERLFGFSILPILKDYPVILGSGTLLWLTLLGLLLACGIRREACAVYLPAVLNWGTIMVATPVAYSLRYVFVFALGLPLYVLLPLMMAKRRAED